MKLRESLRAAPDAGPGSVANLGDDPRQQWSIRSTSRLARAISLLGQDLGRRHVEFDPSNSTRFGARAFVKLEWSTF
jgi:hypothetical protein